MWVEGVLNLLAKTFKFKFSRFEIYHLVINDVKLHYAVMSPKPPFRILCSLCLLPAALLKTLHRDLLSGFHPLISLYNFM
jgi:hypothetical protein